MKDAADRQRHLTRAGHHRRGAGEVWTLPAQESVTVLLPKDFKPLTRSERAVLRRLRRASRYRRNPLARGVRDRVALRRRRKALDGLGVRDLRSLIQIVAELGL